MTNFNQLPKAIQLFDKTIIAIDFGMKVTGLGKFTPGRDPYPIPYDQIVYQSHEQVIIQILKVVDLEEAKIVVLGFPTLLDGKETSMTQKIKEFGKQLAAELTKKFPQTEFFLQDESLSTYEATSRMKNSPRYNFKVDYSQIDALSASIVLEDFLRSN
ncbi:MAG: Holliday junction resolvase RuvX [Bacteriovoracaceae bacterium]